MDKKYIVKNCPALDDQGQCFQGSVLLGTAFKECEEKDCLIKQVIEKCITKQDLYTTKLFAEQILQLFEIEEVNNEI